MPENNHSNKENRHVHPDHSLNTKLNSVKESQPKSKKIKFKVTKKTIIITSVVLLLFVITGGVIYVLTYKKHTTNVISKSKAVNPFVPSRLTGLPVLPSINSRPVTAVMVENSIDARPQSGLDQAGVVFEAIAEGGITRFMAVYQDTQPAFIGPVRSARPYYVSWALGFDADYAHVGGSSEGLQDIQNWGVKDLDEFYNDSAYQRITSRYAPHNVYTGFPQLASLEQSKGYMTSNYSGFIRKKDSPSQVATASKIDFSLSGPDYDPHFDYVPSTNSYLRSQSGAPHIVVDQNGTQKQISPKVVVALVVQLGQGALDSSNAYYSDYTVVGTGQAFIFQDGTVTIGTWTKKSNASQIVFTDSSNNPLKLNAGQTWITAVSDAGSVGYNK